MSSFSALWRFEKTISAESLNRRFKRTYFCVSSFSAFWGHENANFAESCNPLFKCSSISLSRFSSFLTPENAIFPRRKTHGSREHTFVWVHFLHFGGLKMRFLRSHAIFGGWKNPRFIGTRHPRAHFAAFWKPDSFYFSFLWAFWRPEISIDADSWKPRLKGT